LAAGDRLLAKGCANPSESPEKEEKVVEKAPPTFSLLCIDMAEPDLHHASSHEMSIFTRTCDLIS